MHMGQGNNSLRAAMNLSARATWPVVSPAGVPLTSEQDVIAALRFGDAARHSDPHIGAQINELVRNGNEVGFADPVGLYIHDIDLTDFETPDGSSANALLRYTRGEPDFRIRAVFEAPPGATFTLGDVKVDDKAIRFGSQITEKVKIRIRGAARPANPRAPQLKLPGFKVVTAADVQGAELEIVRELPRPSGLNRLSTIEQIYAPE